jgi:hypothetical protein
MIPKPARARDAELKGSMLAVLPFTFTPDKPLPASLVTKLVKERIAEKEKRAKK